MADFSYLKKEVLADWRAQAEWREQAGEDYAFIAGHQWTDDEKVELEEKSRAPVVFNRVAVIMSAVAGSEINNRTEVRFIPREIGDVKPNEVLSAGAEWFRDLGYAEDNESESFTDLLTCGLGWTETALDFEEDDEGEPSIDRIDPREMCWDRFDHSRGLANIRRVARVREIPIVEAEERFPNHDISEIDCGWIKVSDSDGAHTSVPGDQYKAEDGEFTDNTAGTVTVVQVQYRERQRLVEFMTPEGQKKEMTASQWDVIKKRSPILPPHREKRKWIWRQAFLGANRVLDENQPNPEGATFHAMTGHWDDKEKQFYGLLRAMRDPQKFANKWLTQTLHIINTNSKGGVMVESGAIEDPREFEESWAASDGVSYVAQGALSQGKILPKPKAEMPAALMGLTEFAISSIRDASGVNMELLGLRDANQPGVLEYQRRQSAMTTLARFFDALRFYRKRQGESILHFLRHHIAPTGRLVRILKDGQEQFVPLAMDEETRKYDVIVDDAPSAPNEKEKAWDVIQQMLPILQNADMSIDDWTDVLEYSPLPSSFVEKLRAKVESQKQQGPSPQELMMQAELKSKEAEIITKQREMEIKQVEVANSKAEAEARIGLDSRKIELDHLKLEIEAMKINADREKAGLEARRFEHDSKMRAWESGVPMNDNGDVLTHDQMRDQLALAINETRQEIAEGNRALAETQLRTAQALSQAIAEASANTVQAVTAPKELVRDGQGRPVGVRVAQ